MAEPTTPDAPDERVDTAAAADLVDAGVALPRRASGTPSSSRLGLDDLDAPPPHRHIRRGHLAALARDVWHQTTHTLHVARQTAHYLVRRPYDTAAIWANLYEVGVKSALFVVICLGFLGAIINLQGGFQATRIIGDASLIGGQIMPLVVRLLGPTLTGMMVATRVGTGIAAEIGSMVVTEQVDALRMNRAAPAEYLIKPRLIACVVMVPALTTLGITAAFLAGMLVAATGFGTNPNTYADFDLVTGYDLAEGMIKSLAYGIAIPIIAAAAGLRARGGSEGVGEATTQAVVAASLAVIVLDFTIGGVIFFLR